MIARFLIKMGLETVATDSREDVFGEDYDRSREFALLGRKREKWWVLLREDMGLAKHFIIGGSNVQAWAESVKLEVIVVEDDADIFHPKLLYLDALVRLHPRIQPPLWPSDELPEPEYRLLIV